MTNQTKIYHKPTSCNYCGGTNTISATDIINNDMCECYTLCNQCHKKDYWAYGFFESSHDPDGNNQVYDKCEKY